MQARPTAPPQLPLPAEESERVDHQEPPSRDGSGAGQRSAADEEDRIHFFWSALFLTSAALELGLTVGLRGARVGLDHSLDWVGRTSAGLAQSVGILTCLLSVHALLRGVRSGPHLALAVGRGLVGTLPILTVMMAHTQPLPPLVLFVCAAATSAVWMLTALEWQIGSRPEAGWVWLWTLAWIAKAVSATGGAIAWPHGWLVLGDGLASASALILVAGLFVGVTLSSKRPPWTAVGLLTAAFLLARSAPAAGLRDASFPMVLLGRSFEALSPRSSLESFALALSLCVALFGLGRRSARGAPLAIAAVALYLPLSPLSAAAYSLLALEAARWNEQRSQAG
ncbi:MAG TPA: hypothetical protein VLC09_21330 [Polyangiaceae bacterium]|nr:hypothetical protein [Polyangiaceae bacterium]